VRALVDLADYPAAVGELFNIGSTESITILDLARRVLAAVHGAPIPAGPFEPSAERIVFVPYEEAYATGFEDMQRRVPAVGKIQATIGWRPEIALDKTLEQVIAYYRERQDTVSRPV
jgi:UDP-glucose 4-epimerase